MPEISIIIPVYNAEMYLNNCIRSILIQTHTDFELILVDDGSSDQSGNICDKYAEQDFRVKVIHKENGGVSSARNSGLQIAKGKYIMFCDSDDYVEQKWCESLYAIMEKSKVDLAFCAYYMKDNTLKKVSKAVKFSDENFLLLEKEELWNLYMKNLMNMPWNKIYKKEIIEKNNIRFDETISYNEDLIFVLDYIKYSQKKFGICNIPLYCYIQGIEGSLTRSYVPDLWKIKLRVFEEFDLLLNQCGITKDSIKKQYYSKWIWGICGAISSELDKNNLKSKLEKYKKLCTIVHSQFTRDALKYGEFEKETSQFYRKVIKSRCALIIMIYYDLGNMKRVR